MMFGSVVSLREHGLLFGAGVGLEAGELAARKRERLVDVAAHEEAIYKLVFVLALERCLHVLS